ncbi:uncharacterized protein LOC124153186 [Ischnura elegans]|uniref:uncharacterized protein LOC124153186 n=1 Tax=Ischnura elegans TaxID=197161 RepID=UPI001ED8BF6D|nr:uncharacterized protein LOC124153186 [Ischnura elegans]
MADMAVAGWTMLQITVSIVTILVTSFILFAFWSLTYWRRKGIPYLTPKLPFGNANDAFLGRKPFGNVIHEIYRKLSDKPYAGIYMALQPSLLVMDPKLIKDILIRTSTINFQHHIANAHPTNDPYIFNAIFFARGARWRTIRTGLSPAFSSGKMKMMYPHVVVKAKKLASVLEEIGQGSDPKIDAKFHAARYTTDVIASCAFGIEANALEDPGNKFFNMTLKIFKGTFRHALDTMIILQFSSLVRIAGSVFITKDVGDFFSHIVWSVIKEREEKKIHRGDYVDMLIQLKNKGKVYETRDDKKTAVAQEEGKMKIFQHFGGDSLVAHALAFITAGYETSSTALSFALLELARNPDCQEKLINEIDETLKKNNREIDYDALRSMAYLDKVVNETLRKYPALAVLDRYCTEEYRNPEYNLVIPKGMSVLVPVIGIHYDSKYYHDPYRFDPERFGEDTKDNRPSCTYIPFGEGPRICIGMRFAHMMIKAGLVNILSKVRFSVPDKLKEMKELPLDIKSFVVSPDRGLLLTVHKRETSTVLYKIKPEGCSARGLKTPYQIPCFTIMNFYTLQPHNGCDFIKSYHTWNLCMADMAVAGWTMLQITVSIVTILVTSFILFAFWSLTYWRRKGIPYLSPKLPFGNANDAFLGRKPFGNVIHEIYRKLSDKPYAGIYMALQPSLLVMDPNLIKDILIRTAITNFQHHIANPHPTKDPYLSKAIFFARGARWKTIRTGLSPAFSSGKMKMMYPHVVAKAQKLASVLEDIAQGSDPKIDAKFHAARYTIDVIASCAFGIEANALEDPGNKFFNMALKLFERTFRHTMDTMIILQFSSLVRIAGSVFVAKDVADFFRHLVWSVVKEREDKKIQRGDYIDMLIQLKNNGKVYETSDDKKTAVAQDEDKKKIFQHFGGESLVAHVFAFLTAGFETSSTALSFALLELARNPDCQEKLITEIDEALKKNNGEIDYDTLRRMVYLDKVVNETLRKYPPLAVLDRYCTEEYRNPEYNLVIPKGMSVLVPVLGIHYDSKYYHDPYRFDPERFDEETKDNRPSCTFMPFGEGPRICIGMRFGQMMMKAGLVNILSKMRFSVPDKLKEMKELPLDIKSFVVSPDKGLLLTVHKRETSTVV